VSYSGLRRARPIGAWGVATGVEDTCDGQEKDASGGCCPDTSWTEAEYRGIKGDSSVQHYLEARIHEAMWMMTAEQIGQVAWDGGFSGDVTVSPMLTARAVNAARNFEDLYPVDRWVRAPNATRTSDCAPDGYAVWQDMGHPRPAVQIAAVQRILGVGATPAAVEALGSKQQAAVWSVPRDPLATYGQPPLVPSDLFVVQAGQVKPTAFTQTFLDAFSPVPKLSRTMTALKVRKPTAAELAARRRELLARSRAVAKDENVPTVGTWTIVLVGLGVVAAGGALYWAISRRR
jgi:hypothetical protein